jgi:hypothetical protein
LVLGAAFLAVPTVAQAKLVRTAVLRVDSSHHLVRTVDAKQNEVAYRYRGGLPRQVRPGSLVRLVAVGHGIRSLKVTGHTAAIHFSGHVKSVASSGITILIADRRPWLATRHLLGGAATAAAVSTLKVGEAVSVTVAFSGRDAHATVESSTGNGDPSSTGTSGDTGDCGDTGDDPTVGAGDDPSTGDPTDPTVGAGDEAVGADDDPTAGDDPTDPTDPTDDPPADPTDPSDC